MNWSVCRGLLAPIPKGGGDFLGYYRLESNVPPPPGLCLPVEVFLSEESVCLRCIFKNLVFIVRCLTFIPPKMLPRAP